MHMLWENIQDEGKRHDPEYLAEYTLGIVPALCGKCVDQDAVSAARAAAVAGVNASPTTVHNMVSTSILLSSEMPINLSLLAMLLPCSTYDRRRFAAITIRLDNPRCTALLFTSGKLVITGVKSW